MTTSKPEAQSEAPLESPSPATYCVLYLLAEGGSLTVVARADSQPEYAVWLEDQSFCFVDEGEAITTNSPWTTFEGAIRILDRYPWRKLYPRYIDLDHLERVLATVESDSAALSQQHRYRWEDAADACRAGEQRVPKLPG